MRQWIGILILASLTAAGCEWGLGEEVRTDSAIIQPPDTLTKNDSIPKAGDTANLVVNKMIINTGEVDPAEVVSFAKTLQGVPYKYGSTDPQQGFDCSGFITYVFSHFNIKVPRSSIEFTDVGRTIPADSAKPGDLILFTGTDSTEKFVGHMGIIVSNDNGKPSFIHSTSGKAYSVTITPLSDYYMSRYVRTGRIFPQNER